MTTMGHQQLLEVDTTCGSLMNELQLIWDEIGESDEERDEMLLQLEQECLEVYKRKLDQANHARARLHQTLAEIQAEVASLASALGERPPMLQLEKRGSTLKEQLAASTPLLEEMRRQKGERLQQFLDIKSQVHRIQCEISGSLHLADFTKYAPFSEHDLTLRRFDELQGQLKVLQKEKNDRLYKVLEYVNSVHELCAVLGWNSLELLRAVHPSLDETSSVQDKSISNETIEKLANTIDSLRKEKRQRMQKLQDLGTSLIELWNLMDTPVEEQYLFQHVTCNIAAAEHEITAPGALSLDVIDKAGIEVQRLDQLKASKMKELVLKKQTELEEICRKGHIIPDARSTQDTTIASMESGMVDPADLLARIEDEIGRAKEEVFSRKEIMEKIEKWMTACEEESWLEDYNKDDNRYSASRGAHINLKRAERARVTISKIPALVDSIVAKTRDWEEERGAPFLYDGVRLLSTLEEYNILRLEKEEERRRQRDQRRLHEQLVNEQETLFGTKPSPNSRTPSKKSATIRPNGTVTPTNRRLSLGGAMLQSGYQDMQTPRVTVITPVKHGGTPARESRKDQLRPAAQAPANQATLLEDHSNLLAGYQDMQTPRVSAITPVRQGGTPAKESRKDQLRPAAQAPANQATLLEDRSNLLAGGQSFKHSSTSSPISGHEIDGHFIMPATRQPLSPVSASVVRPNMKLWDDGMNKCQLANSPVKNALMKSPLSAIPNSRATAIDEAENTTPQQQQHQHSQQAQMVEYSFEERRLGWTTRTSCR